MLLEMRAIRFDVFIRQLFCRFGNRAARPPSTEGAGDSADQCADRSRRGSESSSKQRSGDAAGSLPNLVGSRRRSVVTPQGRVLRLLDASVDGSFLHLAFPRSLSFLHYHFVCPAAFDSVRKAGITTPGSVRFTRPGRASPNTSAFTRERSIRSRSTRRSTRHRRRRLWP